MGLEEIIGAAETSIEQDRRRRDVFEAELEEFEDDETDTFERTREAIADQRRAIADLREQLATEESEIESLAEKTDYLSVEQATRNRGEAIEKLTEHNRLLNEYADAVTAALDGIERNLDAVEARGPDAVEADPESDLRRARDALERHNETVDGLGKNMRILNAYLM